MGEYDTPSYRGWTLAEHSTSAYFRPQIAEGFAGHTVWLDRGWNSFNMEPVLGHWYIVLIHVRGNEEFVIRLWDQEDPTLYRESLLAFPESWSDRRWGIRLVAGPGYGEDPGFDVERIETLDGLPT